jgi:hypothetical protein
MMAQAAGDLGAVVAQARFPVVPGIWQITGQFTGSLESQGSRMTATET